MERPRARTAILGLILALTAFGGLVPGWIAVQKPYSGAVTALAGAAFPVLGLEGGVSRRVERSVTVIYTLEYARTGGWGQVRQRMLNVPDVPLAAAISVGLVFLPWRRRLLLALSAAATLFVLHVVLVCASAWFLARILADPGIDPALLDELLHRTAERVASYRDVAPVVACLVVGILALPLLPRGRPAPAASSPAPDPV